MLGALVECATVTDSALIFTEFLSISCAAALYALLRLWLFLHAFQYWTHLRCPKQKRMNSAMVPPHFTQRNQWCTTERRMAFLRIHRRERVRAYLWIVSETCAISAETDSLMTACGHQRTISMRIAIIAALRVHRSQTDRQSCVDWS